MSMNFASSALHTTIFCNTVSIDGFEVGNLISVDDRLRSAGFLAEAFVVPPVHITLSFPCAIDIDKVIVNGQLNSQKSVGFQVFTAVSDNRSSQLVDKFDSRVFCPVARCNSAIKPLISFSNARYKPRDELPPGSPDVSDDALHERLYHHVDKFLSHVNALTLSVTRTANGSAVAVKKFEVWGQPALGTPKDLVLQLKRDVTQSPMSPPASPPPENVESFGTVDADRVVIPPEFLDSITCELMSVPILLPCGMSIDRATLDRHISSEREWGRPPSDPFTGRTFNDNHKPVVHTALKARVDRFVTVNADCLTSLPKVVRSNGSSGLVSSRLVQLNDPIISSACDKAKRQLDCVDSAAAAAAADVPLPSCSSDVASASSDNRRTRPAGAHLVNKSAMKHVACSSIPTRLSMTSRATFRLPDWKRIKLADETSTSDVQRSADVDRHSSIGRLEALGCGKCNELANVYRLPCSHRFCRECLLIATRCQVCDISFSTSDPVRVHY